MPRQRLDTKQEPKYTETNKTQVDTMKLTRTERDTGEDNQTENTRTGQNQKQQEGTAVAVTLWTVLATFSA